MLRKTAIITFSLLMWLRLTRVNMFGVIQLHHTSFFIRNNNRIVGTNFKAYIIWYQHLNCLSIKHFNKKELSKTGQNKIWSLFRTDIFDKNFCKYFLCCSFDQESRRWLGFVFYKHSLRANGPGPSYFYKIYILIVLTHLK